MPVTAKSSLAPKQSRCLSASSSQITLAFRFTVTPLPRSTTSYQASATMEYWLRLSWLPDRIQEPGRSFPGIGDLPVPKPSGLPKSPVKFATCLTVRNAVAQFWNITVSAVKRFSQLMREADAIEKLWKAEASSRRLGNLRRGQN